MLGVFSRSTAKQPEGLVIPSLSELPDWITTGHDVKLFYDGLKADTHTIFYNFQNGNFMALSQNGEPRTVAVMDEIVCIFSGILENLHSLRVQYGLSRDATEAMVLFAAYKALRDRGPFPADQVVREFMGKYAFMLFDTKDSRVFLARDRDGGMGLHWGTAADGSLVCCNESRIIVAACGGCFSPFPPGFFFLSGCGVKNFDHPNHEVTVIEHKNNSGKITGIDFQVDLEAGPRVLSRNDSGENWSLPDSLDFDYWTLGFSSGNENGQQQQQNRNLEIGSASGSVGDGDDGNEHQQ